MRHEGGALPIPPCFLLITLLPYYVGGLQFTLARATRRVSGHYEGDLTALLVPALLHRIRNLQSTSTVILPVAAVP